MNTRIVLVDDDKNLLNSIIRQLRGKYELFTTEFPAEGLEYLKKRKDTALIISDYKMPVMNGAEFLRKSAEISPDSIRMMLTGQADMDAIVEIINEGNIFRFLTKPCSPDLFVKNIDDALRQYQLVMSEKDLLSKTLSGSIQVMMDIMVLAKPQVFAKSLRIKNYVGKMLSMIQTPNKWQIEIAAVMSQIGCITIPDEILQKSYKNLPLEPEDRALLMLYTKTSSDIICKIPRLEPVAQIVKYQEKFYDGEGIPNDNIKGNSLPLGSRIIKIATDYDSLLNQNVSHEDAISKMISRTGKYDESILKILNTVISQNTAKRKYIVKEVSVNELTNDMHLSREITTSSGIVLGSSKQLLSQPLIQTLKNYVLKKEIPDRINVLIYE
ncbi:MAG: response regulator [Spirochaetes bacterium]|nr:response regulator [Spirochaetota bacterium]